MHETLVLLQKNQSNSQKIHMQCQRKQCLMEIHSETQRQRQITMQKQGSINSV